MGTLRGDVTLREEKHPLGFLTLAEEDFFDLDKFAGEGNIGHMVEQVRQFGCGHAEGEEE